MVFPRVFAIFLFFLSDFASPHVCEEKQRAGCWILLFDFGFLVGSG
jgi:hypothetical protein